MFHRGVCERFTYCFCVSCGAELVSGMACPLRMLRCNSCSTRLRSCFATPRYFWRLCADGRGPLPRLCLVCRLLLRVVMQQARVDTRRTTHTHAHTRTHTHTKGGVPQCAVQCYAKSVGSVPRQKKGACQTKKKRGRRLTRVCAPSPVDLQIYQIYEGTSQIQRLIVSRNMYTNPEMLLP